MVKRALALTLLTTALGWTEPTGPQVIHGGVNIQNLGPTTLINQSTDRAIINWNGFNIDVHELVRFVQPNQLSVILNRVVGSDPSQILGQMQANGRVFLINPNGVVFGPNAKVDVGGLLATTLNLTDQDFLAGRYHLTQDANKQLASVVNQGELKIADGGFLLLVAPMVDNQGVILAKAGQVGLIGSREATLNFDGQGLIEITVPQATQSGTVALEPRTVSEVLRQVVADPQIVEAEGLVLQQGRILGQRVLLNSTQATLATAGSSTEGGDVRILSQGTARLDGQVTADFAELSGRHFGLTGSVTANLFLLDPDTIHIIDGSNTGPDEISRASLEAMPAGTLIALEAQRLIQVNDMASDEINLAPNVSLHLTVFDGDIRFQDTRDRLNTSNGGSYRFDAPNGTVAAGDLRAPGGSVTLHAGLDVSFDTISTYDVLSSRTPGPVDIQAGRDILLGGIAASHTQLEAGRDILNAVPDGGSVQGGSASFVAGGRVGTQSDPVFLGIDQISGQASEFNFRYETPPQGLDGLTIRQPENPQPNLPATPPSPPNPPNPQIPPAPIVFQINERTQDPFPGPPTTTTVTTSAPGDIDQSLLDALAFVSGLPGYRLTSQTRVSDLYSMHVDFDDITPLFEALGERGWSVRMTGERLLARKNGQLIWGSLTPTGADLQVSPDPITDAKWIDFTQLFEQLEKGLPVEIQVDQYRLSALLEALGQRGWRARLTTDRLQAQRNGLRLDGVLEGSKATLQIRKDKQP